MAVVEAVVGNASPARLLGDREPPDFSRERGPKLAALSLLVHVLTAVIAWCVVQSNRSSADQSCPLFQLVMLNSMLRSIAQRTRR